MRKSENPLSPNENIDMFGYQVKTAWLLRFSGITFLLWWWRGCWREKYTKNVLGLSPFWCVFVYKLIVFPMEKGIQQGNEENGQEKEEKTYGETDAVIVKTPLNTVNVVVESENVEVDTNEMYKRENGQDFVIDSEDREVQEDDSNMENQGRRIISTLTSKHYAAHVRLFKGNISLYMQSVYWF